MTRNLSVVEKLKDCETTSASCCLLNKNTVKYYFIRYGVCVSQLGEEKSRIAGVQVGNIVAAVTLKSMISLQNDPVMSPPPPLPLPSANAANLQLSVSNQKDTRCRLALPRRRQHGQIVAAAGVTVEVMKMINVVSQLNGILAVRGSGRTPQSGRQRPQATVTVQDNPVRW